MGERLSYPDSPSSFYEKLPPQVRRTFEENGATAEHFKPNSDRTFAKKEPIPGVFPSARSLGQAEAQASAVAPHPEPKNRKERRAKETAERIRRDDGNYRSARGRREEIRERMRKNSARDSEHLRRVRARLKSQGVSMVPPLRVIPGHTWIMSREVQADQSGRAATIHLRQLRNKVAAGAILRAALGTQPDGTTLRTWTDRRARMICALGLALVQLAVGFKRRSHFTMVVRGITRGALAAILQDPHDGGRPGLTTLTGVPRPGRGGYVLELIRAGLCRRIRIPAEDADECEKWGPWTSNRYEITCSMLASVWDGTVRERLLALHELGAEAAHWIPKRDKRGGVVATPRSQPTATSPPPPS